LKKDIAKQLAAFERKVLRRMCGGINQIELGESDIKKN
jgi:hypothetical protein